jgi:ribose transport system permease protein
MQNEQKANGQGRLWHTVKNILFSPELTVLIPIIILCVITTLNNPLFMSWANFSVMLKAMIFLAFAAMGQAIVIMSGEIDLSVGANAGFSGTIFAMCATNFGLGIIPSLALGIIAGMLIGFINGYLVSSFGLVNFITTLATMFVCQGLSVTLSGGEPIVTPAYYLKFSLKAPLGLSWLFFIFVGIFILMEIAIRYSTIGRRLKAVGGNGEAALMAGINKKKVKWTAYIISGMLCGIAGIMMVIGSGATHPEFGVGLEFRAIAACAVGGIALSGGKGTILGVGFGVLLLQILANCLQLLKVENNWQLVFIGLILVGAALIDNYKRRLQARGAA